MRRLKRGPGGTRIHKKLAPQARPLPIRNTGPYKNINNYKFIY